MLPALSARSGMLCTTLRLSGFSTADASAVQVQSACASVLYTLLVRLLTGGPCTHCAPHTCCLPEHNIFMKWTSAKGPAMDPGESALMNISPNDPTLPAHPTLFGLA